MTRKEKENYVQHLPQNWYHLMLAFQKSRDTEIERDRHEPFSEEIVRCHETHYDELLDKIIDLAARKPN